MALAEGQTCTLYG